MAETCQVTKDVSLFSDPVIILGMAGFPRLYRFGLAHIDFISWWMENGGFLMILLLL